MTLPIHTGEWLTIEYYDGPCGETIHVTGEDGDIPLNPPELKELVLWALENAEIFGGVFE